MPEEEIYRVAIMGKGQVKIYEGDYLRAYALEASKRSLDICFDERFIGKVKYSHTQSYWDSIERIMKEGHFVQDVKLEDFDVDSVKAVIPLIDSITSPGHGVFNLMEFQNHVQ